MAGSDVKVVMEDDFSSPQDALLNDYEDQSGDVSGSIDVPPSKSEKQSKDSQIQDSWVSLFTLNYYQGFFDVTTREVMERVVAGMIPFPWKLIDKLKVNPDLYGPFWLATTLVLTVAISGNLVDLFQDSEKWEFQFHKVTVIGSVVYSYIWLIPAVIWALMWWRGNRLRHTLLQLLAIYGYSIAIFIPLTILWIINSEIVRWCLLAVGTALSASVLATSLWKPLSSENSKFAVCVLGAVILMHAGLSVGFKFYYFSSSSTSSSPLVTTAAASATKTLNDTLH